MALAVVGLPVTYFAIANSDAFRSAEAFLRADASIQKEFGEIENVSLILLGAQSIAGIGGANGHAALQLSVKGRSRSGVAKLNLEKVDGIWRIIDGEAIPDGASPVMLRAQTLKEK